MSPPASLRRPAALKTGSGAPEKAAKRAYRGERREEQKRLTHGRVLEAALELFAERGFEAASLRDIGAKAGVSHAVIRLHFGNKAQLWQQTVDFLFRRMQSEMRPMPGDPDYAEGTAGLELFVRRYVAYCARHPEHARLMLMESMHDSEQLRYAVDEHIRPAHQFLERMLKAAVADGFPLDLPPAHMTYILAAASQSVFALAHEARRIYGVDVLGDDFVAHHADAVVRLLFRQ